MHAEDSLFQRWRALDVHWTGVVQAIASQLRRSLPIGIALGHWDEGARLVVILHNLVVIRWHWRPPALVGNCSRAGTGNWRRLHDQILLVESRQDHLGVATFVLQIVRVTDCAGRWR